ncbi:MAG: YiiD C-terminal domain-containing protein [Opitutaceae bacterium]
MRPIPSLAEVEAYLHGNIPLSAAMDVRVIACAADGVILRAPLAPNINPHSMVFGGSTSAVAILSAWTWLNFALQSAGHASRLVIQRSAVDYTAPITGEFEARCAGLVVGQFEEFIRTLDRYSKARATLSAELTCNGEMVATFTGDYVAARE